MNARREIVGNDLTEPFFSGSFGSGLAILSRFPILETHTHPYSLNGHPVMVHHGDWIVAKAAGCATIDVDGLGLVDFWVTHVRIIEANTEGVISTY